MLMMTMNMIRPYLRQVVRNDEGVTAVEYSIMAALIAVVLVAAMGTLGGGIKGAFATIAGEINPAAP
jgi:pilus assembly protein Flp/PilA